MEQSPSQPLWKQQCLYSRYPAVEIVHSISAAAVIPAIDKILSDIGIPFKLGTDNGPPFNSLQFQDYVKNIGFQHIWVTPYALWSNETIGNFMRNLGKVLRMSSVLGTSWKTELQHFLCSYRATPHSTSGFPPSHIMFNGRTYNTRI